MHDDRNDDRWDFRQDEEWRPPEGDTQGGPPTEPRTHPLATTALVLGVLSPLCCGLFTGIPAIIIGLMAKSRISREPNMFKGTPLALIGILLGILGILLSIVSAVVFTKNFEQARVRSQAAVVQAEMRNMAVALESFRVFESRLPTDREFYAAYRQPGGTISATDPVEKTLTSPVAHITQLPTDPYHAPKGTYHYGYAYAGEKGKEVWVLRSYGPDGDADADLDAVLQAILTRDPQQMQNASAWFFDPANGLDSGGDIIKTGP